MSAIGCITNVIQQNTKRGAHHCGMRPKYSILIILINVYGE